MKYQDISKNTYVYSPEDDLFNRTTESVRKGKPKVYFKDKSVKNCISVDQEGNITKTCSRSRKKWTVKITDSRTKELSTSSNDVAEDSIIVDAMPIYQTPTKLTVGGTNFAVGKPQTQTIADNSGFETVKSSDASCNG